MPANSRSPLPAVLVLAPLLANADAGIVCLGLPALQRDLGLPLGTAQWLITLPLIIVGALQLGGGGLADRWGAAVVFRRALLAYGISSVLCAVSATGPALLAARAGQATATALLVPAAMSALVVLATGPRDRVRALAVWARAGGLGSLAGVVAGGLATDLISWRVGFLVQAAVAAAGVLVIRRRLGSVPAPEPGDLPSRVARRRGPVTSALTAATMAALIFGLGHPATAAGASALLLAAAGGAVLLRRRARPASGPRAAGRRPMRFGFCGILLVSGATGPVLAFTSLRLQDGYGFGPAAAGIAVLPLVGSVLVVGGVCSRILLRHGARTPYQIGSVTIATGLTLMVLAPGHGSVPVLLLGGALLVGAGLPFVWLTCESAGLRDAGPGRSGRAAALLQSAGQLGGAAGTALAVTGAGPSLLIALVPALLALVNPWQTSAHEIVGEVEGEARPGAGTVLQMRARREDVGVELLGDGGRNGAELVA